MILTFMHRVAPIVHVPGRERLILSLISAMRSGWLELFAVVVLFTRTFWRR